jgi:hypothetical protein
VVWNEVDNYANSVLFRFGHQVVEIIQGAKKRVDVFVIAYVIARVFLRRLKEG